MKSFRRRNRKLDPARRWAARRRAAAALLLAGSACLLLGSESSLPRASSMGFRVDLRALQGLDLPFPDLVAFEWRSWLRTPFLRLQRVHFLGLERLDARQLTEPLGLSEGVALVDVDPAEVCATLRAHGRIEACTAVRIPPGTLAVAVRERTPVAVIEVSGEGISAAGERLTLLSGEAQELPWLAGEIQRGLAYVQAARDARIPLRRIQVLPRGSARAEVALWPKDRRLRVLAGPDPLASLLRYRAVLETGAIEREDQEIDLRFRERVYLRELTPPRSENEGGEA